MAKRRTIGDNPLDVLSQIPAMAQTSALPEAGPGNPGLEKGGEERSRKRPNPAGTHGKGVPGKDSADKKAEAVPKRTTSDRQPPANLPVQVERPAVDAAADGDRLRYADTSWRTWWDRAIHADIRIVGGSFPLGRAYLARQGLGTERRLALPGGKSISLKDDVAKLAVVARRADRSAGALLLWGAAGAFIGGPVGAAAAGLFGGRERQLVAFDLELTDGRLIQAEAHPAAFMAIEEEMA